MMGVPVPHDRVAWGAAWHRAWDRAHREMRIYDRQPSVHLIDQIVVLDAGRRGWLTDHFDWIASTTCMPRGKRDLNDPHRTVWFRKVIRFDMMEVVTVRVVLEADGREIVTVVLE